jgi:Cys-tRNA(Pro)/Cys-tRNA(Cys) deacylase
MMDYEGRLRAYIADHDVAAEILQFEQSCHSVAEAAAAVGAPEHAFVKNICMIDGAGSLVVGIVKGEDRLSTANVGGVVGTKVRMATPEEIVAMTGYAFGGTPSFGFEAIFLVDERVMETDIVYTGGGTAQSLARISSKELLRANDGTVCSIRK